MPNCTIEKVSFTKYERLEIEAFFNGSNISHDGSVLLLREIDRIMGLTSNIAEVLNDPRDPSRIVHI